MNKLFFSLLVQLCAAFCCNAQPCSNWLFLPKQVSYVNIGDLDIPGNKLTVEATVNRISFKSNGVLTDGDIVSKHTGPSDVNYTLRPTCALITTSKGFFATPPVCTISLNKTYHFAMVYDGVKLKFYRNGFLMKEIPASGDLIQNDLNTFIGFIPNKRLDENFIGYINEVRIWKVARTQEQIRSYMNSSLPNPTTQQGLAAYYIFDNLDNKQGNSEYDGAKGGSAVVNATNPDCNFIADSCNIIVPLPKMDPVADFTYTNISCDNVNFKVSQSENVKSYKWDLGDNNFSTEQSVTHLYKNGDNYIVKLIATGTSGKEITIIKNITITKPNAAFTYQAANEKNTFTFNIANKQEIKYKWFFGDGEVSDKTEKVTHTYKQVGNYKVLLIAEDKNGCTDTVQQAIAINSITSTPPVIEKRENKLIKELAVTSDSLSVSFYDNAEIDGDSVTIIYNKKIIATHLFLTDKAKTFKLPVDKTGGPNELIMYAENLGSIPPNTALMVVYDGKKRNEISIRSTKSSSGMVRFVFTK